MDACNSKKKFLRMYASVNLGSRGPGQLATFRQKCAQLGLLRFTQKGLRSVKKLLNGRDRFLSLLPTTGQEGRLTNRLLTKATIPCRQQRRSYELTRSSDHLAPGAFPADQAGSDELLHRLKPKAAERKWIFP